MIILTINQVASEAMPVSEERLSLWRSIGESGCNLKVFLVQSESFHLLFKHVIFLPCTLTKSLMYFSLILRCSLLYSSFIFGFLIDSFRNLFGDGVHIRALLAQSGLLRGRLVIFRPVNRMKLKSLLFSD